MKFLGEKKIAYLCYLGIGSGLNGGPQKDISARRCGTYIQWNITQP